MNDRLTDMAVALFSAAYNCSKVSVYENPAKLECARRMEPLLAALSSAMPVDKGATFVGSRLAVISHQPTTGVYSVYERGSTVLIKSWFKSEDEAKAWCHQNGWELPVPDLTNVVAALVSACADALDERRNFSGLSDDSEPVLSQSTRNKLRAAIALSKSSPSAPAAAWAKRAARELAIWYAQRDDNRTEHDAGHVESIILKHHANPSKE